MNDELLKEGQQLAALIEKQNTRCSLAPNNRQESRRLEQLQAKWQAWEQEAIAVGVNLEEEFGEKLTILRPVVLNVNPFGRQRRTLNAYELHVLGTRQPERNREKPPSRYPLENWP